MEPLYIAATFGEQHYFWPEVAFIEGLFCTCTNCSFRTWVPGRYMYISIAVGLYSGVAVKARGSSYMKSL